MVQFHSKGEGQLGFPCPALSILQFQWDEPSSWYDDKEEIFHPYFAWFYTPLYISLPSTLPWSLTLLSPKLKTGNLSSLGNCTDPWLLQFICASFGTFSSHKRSIPAGGEGPKLYKAVQSGETYQELAFFFLNESFQYNKDQGMKNASIINMGIFHMPILPPYNLTN